MKKTAPASAPWTPGGGSPPSARTSRSKASRRSTSNTLKPALIEMVVVSAALLAGACAAPRKMAEPGFDFSQVRRISVVPFEGAGGPAATDEFVRALVGSGIEVADAHHPGDVIL